MRIIAGTARSMPLKTIEGKDTRPTTDRIKETLFNILQMDAFNHQVEIERGVLEEECSTLISGFFADLREQKKQF